MLEEVEFFKDASGRGDKRFSDVRTREEFAFKDDTGQASFSKVSSSSSTSRTTTDNPNIKGKFSHPSLLLQAMY
jgi:hypothetical protein